MKKLAVIFFAAITVDFELVDKICFGKPLIFFEKRSIESEIGWHRVLDFVLEKITAGNSSTLLNYPAGSRKYN